MLLKGASYALSDGVVRCCVVVENGKSNAKEKVALGEDAVGWEEQ
jgi:hypothetical protein